MGIDKQAMHKCAPLLADELFRVVAVAHPQIDLVPMHMTKAVQDMTTRVLAGAGQVRND